MPNYLFVLNGDGQPLSPCHPAVTRRLLQEKRARVVRTIPFFASATDTLLFRQLYQMIPGSLAEAARIDGAGPLQFLWNIIVPISRTNIAALFLIEFIYMWNQYLWPLIIANAETTRVIQVGLKQLIATDAAMDWNIVMAGVVVAMIPPLLVLLFLQSSLVTGLSLAEEKQGNGFR
ncbi:MAG TPA: ABC transporter permease subunit [Anaerolineae bacterium]|nr:ABC transporter permease subunit [Anaerolineae bacterium]HIQ05324.1 ABC transporter permease subunit [Anaerolineae bacterium]